MNIQNHIRSLLYRNDCVIVDGFGAFVCQRNSAFIDDGVIYPPRKIVNFNPSLNTDDGLLAKHIAIQEKVSFQIARQNIHLFSEQLLSKLHEDKHFDIKHIGSFSLSKEDTILFEADQNHKWLLEAYGLPSLQPHHLPKEIEHNNTLELAPSGPVREVKKFNYWRYAAIGLLAIGIFGASEVVKRDVKQHNITQSQKAKSIVQQTIQESSFVIPDPLTPLKIEVAVDIPKGPYHIIGGAFRIKGNADKKINQLRDLGFRAHYLGENAYGLHQVAYESYSTKTDALKALRTIKKENNSDAWLFVKEL